MANRSNKQGRRLNTAADPHFARTREALLDPVDLRGLRPVAREVGVSPSGLKKTLAGSTPYVTTRRLYVAWLEQHDGSSAPLEEGEARRAAALLVRDLPAETRSRYVRTLLQAVQKGYEENGSPVPDWLPGLSRG